MRVHRSCIRALLNCRVLLVALLSFASAGPAANRVCAQNAILGEIRIVGFNFAPRGWASCDGQLLEIEKHKDLFAVLGTTYGGDGKTTFGLPDLRGRIAVHPGEAPGLPGVVLGQKLEAKKLVAATGEGETAGTRAYQNLRYVIAFRGLAPQQVRLGNGSDLVGEVRLFAGKDAPRGWIFCDGQQLKSDQHTSLFAAIRNTYGGNGDTTFAVPDLRGRCAVHVGSGPGLEYVGLGEKLGGDKVTASSDPKKSTVTRPGLGIHYMISLGLPAPDAEEVERRFQIAVAERKVVHAKYQAALAARAACLAELELNELSGKRKEKAPQAEGLKTKIRMIDEETKRHVAGLTKIEQVAGELAAKRPQRSEPFLGEIRMTAAKYVPGGWETVDGQLHLIRDNSALFSLFGTMYGGDGRTVFGAPRLRGRAPVSTPSGTSQGALSGGDSVVASGQSPEGVLTTPAFGLQFIVARTGLFPPRN